ncbi:MAG: twin-arginine translocation signal domain-containing protein [Actinomycetota bacterium]|nr:twin-arginine translocation signal domain-containing protein [Actinomycetota bacterium]
MTDSAPGEPTTGIGRRQFLTAAGATALGGVLAACGSSGSSKTAAAPTTVAGGASRPKKAVRKVKLLSDRIVVMANPP